MSDHYIRIGGWHVHAKAAMCVVTVLTILLLYTAYGFTGRELSAVPSDDTVRLPWSSTLYNESESAAVKKKAIIESVRRVRLLCLILTMEKDLDTKVAAVNKTWATRCDKHFYIIYSKQRRHDFLNVDVPDDRRNLVHKMKKVYQEIYDKYRNDFDFLLKADDDSYVIVENLKFLLSHYNANEPGYLGYHFNKFVQSGYMSGGAGYVISNRGLRHLIERGYQNGLCEVKPRKDDPENSEDIETGRCLEASGVPVWSSLDIQGRESFHPYPLEQHLFGKVPGYMYSWSKHPVKSGKDCCSRYTISFHYLSPDAILFLHHLLYETTVFGLTEENEITGPVFGTKT